MEFFIIFLLVYFISIFSVSSFLFYEYLKESELNNKIPLDSVSFLNSARENLIINNIYDYQRGSND